MDDILQILWRLEKYNSGILPKDFIDKMVNTGLLKDIDEYKTSKERRKEFKVIKGGNVKYTV